MTSCFVLTVVASGCTRSQYRMAADRDSYWVMGEKANCFRLPLHQGFTVAPDARSRFYDPTNPDCPQLPIQRPVLYGYAIPPLHSSPNVSSTPIPTPPSQANLSSDPSPTLQLPPSDGSMTSGPQTSPSSSPPPTSQDAAPTSATPIEVNLPQGYPVGTDIPPLDSPFTPSVAPAEQFVMPAGFLVQPAEGPLPNAGNETRATGPVPEDLPPTEPQPENASSPRDTSSLQQAFAEAGTRRVTIPQNAWDVLPETCTKRMFEFPTLRKEYNQSFPEKPLTEDIDTSVQRLTLANLMELALINSREYQTRKEVLYRTALAVTRQRYQFSLNPTPFGNGTAANYQHQRNDGTTVNRLSIPSGVGVQQTLASGGEFLARFANSVVLTFNGPSGFAADVGSEMIFDFQQTVFQRDVRFENLTQSERDVVYAMRDYIRFRKQLFRDVANQYYNLLVNYRGIEINAQDYFTNLRVFIQAQAEYRTAEKIPRIQVDQVEQTVLRARSNLVTNCFNLESGLDQLKFRLGLPTELPINIDLTELRSISLKDELSVARQMINRTRGEIFTAKASPIFDPTSLANVAEVLSERMLNIIEIQRLVQRSDPNIISESSNERSEIDQSLATAMDELESLRFKLQLLGAKMQVDVLRAEFDAQVNADLPVPPLRVLIRAIEFASAELVVVDLALSGQKKSMEPSQLQQLQAERDRLLRQLAELTSFLERISNKVALDIAAGEGDDFARIPEMMEKSVQLVKDMDRLGIQVTRGLLPENSASIKDQVVIEVDNAIELSDQLLANGPDGWTDIEIDHDEALLTSLVQRLDLMNQRGDLADAWRQIKLAGDDLRSIVDLRATHVLRTNSNRNDPFDFTFDDSDTRLSVALDTPLNRRLQRNNFRVALINYNVGLRNLLAAEDSIKLDVREDLRQLSLDRNQYEIAVASAALASERVISTSLRLKFSVQNVQARDFLESQQAYTNALNTIARQHINYIIDRLELFFDLEAFDVDPLGYWDGVNEDYGPRINVDFPSMNPRPYDCLPPRVWYSPTIRHMEHIPPGESIIAKPPQ